MQVAEEAGQRPRGALGLNFWAAVSHLMWVMERNCLFLWKNKNLSELLSHSSTPCPNVFEDNIFSAEKILYVLNIRKGFIWLLMVW